MEDLSVRNLRTELQGSMLIGSFLANFLSDAPGGDRIVSFARKNDRSSFIISVIGSCLAHLLKKKYDADSMICGVRHVLKDR